MKLTLFSIFSLLAPPPPVPFPAAEGPHGPTLTRKTINVARMQVPRVDWAPFGGVGDGGRRRPGGMRRLLTPTDVMGRYRTMSTP